MANRLDADPKPVSRTKKQKQPAQTAGLKAGSAIKYFNQSQPRWDVDRKRWLGWLGAQSAISDPIILFSQIRADIQRCGPEFDQWPGIEEMLIAASKCSRQWMDWGRDGTQYWLSRVVEQHGLNIYSHVWKRAFAQATGRVADRITEADGIAKEAESNWTKRFP